MKPTSKQLSVLQKRIASRYSAGGRSNAEIGRLASVHPSQVGRICAGDFKTVSANVVQVCRVLGVKVPKMVESAKIDPEWAKANASLRRIWDHTPQGAATIRRVLDAIADLQVPEMHADGTRSEKQDA
jgi:hypothetical protein